MKSSSRDPWLVFAGMCAIGGFTWCALTLLDGCRGGDPIQPNPVAADCLLARDTEQNACVRLDAGFAERQACLERVRAKRDCTKDGGA